MILASLPSPTRSVWHLGPLPIRAYALCIVLGIVVALIIATRRWVARGGEREQVGDIAAWAIVLGIIGGRLYHVVTTPELYFGSDGHPMDVFKVWEGGLGIWGAIALGGLGVLIGCRRHRVRFRVFADAAAPGIVAAQAIGRWGNWFNNELYGRPTDLPWRLGIHEMDLSTGQAVRQPDGSTVIGYFHPTFLYESLWCAAVCVALILVDRRFRMGDGRVFALYAALYSAGRFGVESLRIDDAHHFLGLRLNEWTSLAVVAGGIAWMLLHRGPREASPRMDDPPGADGEQPDEQPPGDAEGGGDADAGGDAGAGSPASSESVQRKGSGER